MKKAIAIPIISVVIYIIYFYFLLLLLDQNNFLISQDNVTWDNLFLKILFDFCAMLLFPMVLIILNRKDFKNFELCYKSRSLIYILTIVIITLFIVHDNYTIAGIYRFFFYIFVIAFAEEFIYVGYLYNKLKDHSKITAIIITGTLWGIPHAFLPAVLSNSGILQLVGMMLSQIGGGIAMGWYFIYIKEKSKTLWVPILIHAILDYSKGTIGVIVALSCCLYLYIKRRNE